MSGEQPRRRAGRPAARPAQHGLSVHRGDLAPGAISDIAYAEIKRRILELEMGPGTPFKESELSASLGTSKSPVREALGRLRREGLVEVAARSGYRVSPVTLRRVRELFGLRAVLEAEVASLAAARGARFDSLKSQARSTKRTATPGADLRRHTEFHLSIADLSGSVLLRDTLRTNLEELERVYRVALSAARVQVEPADHHAEVIEAIEAGDSERARTAALAEVRAAQETVMDVLLSTDAVMSANLVNEAEHRMWRGA